MAKLINALEIVFKHEGGVCNNPHDPGGTTNRGISLRFVQGLPKNEQIDLFGHPAVAADIVSMRIGVATRIYDQYFWSANHYDKIDSQAIANRVMDYCVNMGAHNANCCLQRALHAVGHSEIIDDGVLGDKTFNAVNSVNNFELIAALKSEGANYYRDLIRANPKLEEFKTGWLNRVFDEY